MAELSKDQILARLGANPQDPNAQLLTTKLGGRITEKGRKLMIKYHVEIDVELQVNVSLAQVAINLDFDIVEATPKIAYAEAKNELRAFEGGTTYQLLDIEERVQLFSESDSWRGIQVGIQPVKSLSSKIGKNRSVVEFETPIASAIYPGSTQAELQDEIGEKRRWEGLKARVIETNHSLLSEGKTFTGQVEISPISTSLSLPPLRGGPRTVTSDHAYQIKTDFGSDEITRALGIYPVMKYYLDEKNKDFVAIVSDSDTRTSEMTYFTK